MKGDANVQLGIGRELEIVVLSQELDLEKRNLAALMIDGDSVVSDLAILIVVFDVVSLQDLDQVRDVALYGIFVSVEIGFHQSCYRILHH